MALYRHVNGPVWDIDLDGCPEVMRRVYEEQIAKGDLALIEPEPQPVKKATVKKPAAKKAAPAPKE